MDLSWEAFEREIGELSGEIDYKPDAIAGIVRGGIIPARMLSSKLGVKQMYCLNVSKKGEERIVTTEIKDDLSGQEILLVEDMLETGRSMVIAKGYLEGKGASVRTACLYTMPISEIKPDYFLREVEENMKFPWE